MSSAIEDEIYQVVRNGEEQYSIWRANRTLPQGWYAAEFTGSKDECLAHIDEVWTDMRPLSLRRALAAAESAPPSTSADADQPRVPGPTLVQRLQTGDHPVEVVIRPEPSAERFRRALDERYIHVRFTDTIGGTELGSDLSGDGAVDTSECDLAAGIGTVALLGDLTLDFQPVRCRVRIELPGLTGSGCLNAK